MKPHFTRIALAALVLVASTATVAAEQTKDIVLDRLAAPVLTSTTVQSATGDAMAVSVLLESPDGSLTPRSTQGLFNTGDRFRVKVLASRPGTIALYNTNPAGVLSPEPVWRGEVKVGQETISPRLRLDGQSGVDLLHIVLEPSTAPSTAPAAAPTGLFAWLSNALRGVGKEGGAEDGTKDIRLDSQSTASTTYIINPRGLGLVSTMRIVHR